MVRSPLPRGAVVGYDMLTKIDGRGVRCAAVVLPYGCFALQDDFSLVNVHSRVGYRWTALMKADHLSYHGGSCVALIRQYWRLNIGTFSCGRQHFSGMYDTKLVPGRICIKSYVQICRGYNFCYRNSLLCTYTPPGIMI